MLTFFSKNNRPHHTIEASKLHVFDIQKSTFIKGISNKTGVCEIFKKINAIARIGTDFRQKITSTEERSDGRTLRHVEERSDDAVRAQRVQDINKCGVRGERSEQQKKQCTRSRVLHAYAQRAAPKAQAKKRCCSRAAASKSTKYRPQADKSNYQQFFPSILKFVKSPCIRGCFCVQNPFPLSPLEERIYRAHYAGDLSKLYGLSALKSALIEKRCPN